jgi:biopolymer transport protein ExbD
MHHVEIGTTRKRPRELSMVPMINVMLLMLFFFIVTGNVGGDIDVLPVKYPFSEQAGTEQLGEAVVTLGIHDEILADEEIMFSPEELHLWVEKRIAAKPDTRFTIRADAGMEAVKLIDIMRFLEEAGAEDVVLAAQKP